MYSYHYPRIGEHDINRAVRQSAVGDYLEKKVLADFLASPSLEADIRTDVAHQLAHESPNLLFHESV